MSEAVTEGIRVTVQPHYLPSQSRPSEGRFAFAYTVQIQNESKAVVQLLSRHWIITDADDETCEVMGDGVVGEQPVLNPGQSFEYTSGCVLNTAWGTMHGTYEFRAEAEEKFDAEVAPFLLASDSVGTMRGQN